MLAAKHFFYQKIKNVDFIALPACLKKIVFHVVLHLLSRNVGFTALLNNRMKSTHVDFIALSGFSGFSGFLSFLNYSNPHSYLVAL